MIELKGMLLLAIIMGSLSAFMIQTSGKFGWLDWYDTNRKKWMPERCNFCLGFWLSVIQFILFFSISMEHFELVYVLSMPIAATVNCKLISLI